MTDEVQTWHHSLMARHWAENNTDGPEIAYYQRQIEQQFPVQREKSKIFVQK